MKKSIAISLSAVFLLIIAAIVLYLNMAGKAPEIVPEGTREVGAEGVITLAFPQAMNHQSVVDHFEISPVVQGNFLFDGNLMKFRPAVPLEVGASYQVRLRAGSITEEGQTLYLGRSWRISVREPQLVYLSPTREDSELWVSKMDGEDARQLTWNGGGVFDYSVSPDGGYVVYSRQNLQSGMDLWRVDRLGLSEEMLLDCGEDICYQPSWSPFGDRIAYSRVARLTLDGPDSGTRIWLLDVESRSTAPLFNDALQTGIYPSWSPDEAKLSYLDEVTDEIRIYDFEENRISEVTSLSGEQGSWAPDSTRMVYINTSTVGIQTFANRMFDLDYEHGLTKVILIDEEPPVDYTGLDWSPLGDWIVYGKRELLQFYGRSNSQIWITSPDGIQQQAVTQDFQYSNASFQWSPSGEEIVFQRLESGNSDFRPEIWVWNRDSGDLVKAAQDAALPAWLP